MDTKTFDGIFENISQRVIFSYRNSLSEWIAPEQQVELAVSQRQLHDFFHGLYNLMFDHPDQFGLPVTEDIYIDENEPNEKDKKQEVKAALKKPKDLVIQGIDFLYLAGKNGRLDGKDLVLNLDECAAFVKRSKTGKKFLQGLESAGLSVTISGEQVVLHSARYPEMMLAFKTLAEQCAKYTGEEERLGAFLFARCDFRADGSTYRPDAVELYRIFSPADMEYVSAVHDFFMQRGFKLDIQISDIFSWVVKYQGNKKIKASPLFQIEYQDRYRRSLRLQMKYASTNRIADLILQQPKLVQEDFFSRVFRCRGDECGWCRNQKTLGPSVILRDGTPETYCWYSYSEVRELNENTVDLIKQFTFLHDQLLTAPSN